MRLASSQFIVLQICFSAFSCGGGEDNRTDSAPAGAVGSAGSSGSGEDLDAGSGGTTSQPVSGTGGTVDPTGSGGTVNPAGFGGTAGVGESGAGGNVPAPSSPQFQTVDGECVIEAENFSRVGGSLGGRWSVDDAIPEYRGDGYAHAPSGDPSTLQFSSTNAAIEFDIDFREAGRYYLHLRTYARDHTENGFFAMIDGQQVDYGHPDARYIYVKKLVNNPRWWWYCDGGATGSRGHRVSFSVASPGVKTLAILRRDKGSRVDRIWISRTADSPQDTGELDLPDESLFVASVP